MIELMLIGFVTVIYGGWQLAKILFWGMGYVMIMGFFLTVELVLLPFKIIGWIMKRICNTG